MMKPGRNIPNWVPGWTCVWIGLACGAMVLSVLYTLNLNPEIQFLKRAWQLKSEAIQNSSNDGGRILFCGGSSVLVGIDPEEVEAHCHYPVINLGMAAGMGPGVLTELALNVARTGDFMIVSIEPDLLTMDQGLSMLGSQVSWAVGHPEWVPVNGLSQRIVTLTHLRPGAYHAFTLLGKMLMKRPLYRYQAHELQSGGWQKIETPQQSLGIPVFHFNLTAQGRSLLTRIVQECGKKQVKVSYRLNWHFVPKERLPHHQLGIQNFLSEIARIMPVIDGEGPELTDPSQFADTPWHPKPDLAHIQSRHIGEILRLQMDKAN